VALFMGGDDPPRYRVGAWPALSIMDELLRRGLAWDTIANPFT
jgi:hypothetical protein